MKGNSSGPKADNLLKLRVAGFNVPQFYTVPGSMKATLHDKPQRQALVQAFEDWRQTYGISSVAVRSSSTQEDTTQSSFAGQFTTVLGVQDSQAYLDALTKVVTSKQSTAYSQTNGTVHAIVQEFIEPDCAGVIFSVNPATGSAELVINAATGRGTNVVEGGQAEQYFVDRLDTSSYRVENGSGQPNVLGKEQIQKLSALALQIESLFETPQDIEWAIRDNTIYILQARPITNISHLRLWDSSNIAESFPGIVLPLTFSIAKRGYLLGYKAQAYSAGLSWYELEAHHRTFDSMIGIFNGRMYYNLLSWYRYISLFPGNNKNQKFLDDQIATQGEAIYQAPTKHSLRFRIKYVCRVLYRVLFSRRELAQFYRQFDTFEAEYAALPETGDTQLLMMRYEHIEQTIIPHFGRTLDNDFLVMTYHGWLKRLLEKWLPTTKTENRTIIGAMSGVLSAQQALVLYNLAKDFQSDATTYKLLQDKKFTALDAHLKDTELEVAMHAYLEMFGHRFAEDQKIEVVNPVLEKHGLYKLLGVYVQLDLHELHARLEASSAASTQVEAAIRKQLRADRKWIYILLLHKLKYHLRIREHNRLLRGRIYGHMRELFPKVGQALVAEGVIKRKEDVFYLQIEELFQLMQGSVIENDLPQRIEYRRKAYKEYSKIAMPERFITKSLPSLEKQNSSVAKTTTSAKAREKLPGLISSPGTIEGKILVLTEPKIPKEPYDILVASHTDPGWTPLIALAKGVIVEHGGMLSHAAIVTRELGIPSIIGVPDATLVLKTGMRVRINTQLAQVEILES